MSELKITSNSLENAILTDGNFVSGYAVGNAYIDASGNGAHAEGYTDGNNMIIASGNGAHAEGISTLALANGAHAGGIGTIAKSPALTAIGKYNNTSTNAFFVVGNGTWASRKDAFVIDTGGNVSIGGAATAKVNNISNVLLGVPIGSMTMWLGASVWAGYSYAVENYPDCIPDGWLLANGASVRLRYIGQQDRPHDLHVTTFHNNTDYVYIPRYNNIITKTYDDDNDFDYWDKFELVAYRHNEHLWVAIGSEYSKFNRPDECYVGMNSLEKEIFTRFLNHIILSTRVYVKVTSVIPYYQLLITKDTSYNNDTYDPDSGITDANYLETYGTQLDKLSWYSNLITYSNNPNTGKIDDILIALPDMNLKFPLGARQGDINKNFGDVATRIGNPIFHYANTFIGADGGEETHNLKLDEMYGKPINENAQNGSGDSYETYAFNESPQVTHPHNNIPPYMAVHFIIKYK